MLMAIEAQPHQISAVIPVYRVAEQLVGLLDELDELSAPRFTPKRRPYVVSETVVVFDGESVESAQALRSLLEGRKRVRAVWLSRNFGQHPATLAGMSASSGEWIVTLDEDGQFPASEIASLLDHALDAKSPVVYGQPSTSSPHPLWRRAGSWFARSLFRLLVGRKDWARFSSFRLILGEVGRGVSAYCTNETYLDVALTWVSPRSSSIEVRYEVEPSASGYRLSGLLGHLVRMLLSMGTRPMRIFAAIGAGAAFMGFLLSLLLVYRRLVMGFPVGFASTLSVLLLLSGVILLSLAVLSEYVGLIVKSATGRPLYVAVADPTKSALFRDFSNPGS